MDERKDINNPKVEEVDYRDLTRYLTEEEVDNLKQGVRQLREEGYLPATIPTEEDVRFLAAKMEYQRELSRRHERFEFTPLSDAIKDWLSVLSQSTRQNYTYYIEDLILCGFFPEVDANNNIYTLGHFNCHLHNYHIDAIKKVEEWSEGTRQLHAACYISLTAYLNSITDGWFKRALPSKLAANPTFFQIYDKCQTRALTLSDWTRFIDALDQINERDGLIARCMFQRAKRISEALDLELNQINWDKNIIRFTQKKTGGMIKEIPITYPQHYMNALKNDIESTRRNKKKKLNRCFYYSHWKKSYTFTA